MQPRTRYSAFRARQPLFYRCSVTDRAEVIELVRDAFGRTPPLSATFRSWFHLDRLRRAEQATQESGEGKRVRGMLPAAGDPDTVLETADHLLAATQHGSYRLERTRNGRTAAHLSNGVTTWRPTASGEFHSHPADPDAFPARNLLDPSWLVDYDWSAPSPGVQNSREILAMQARMTANAPAVSTRRTNRAVPTVLRQRPPAEVAVLIDVQYGFLHRMTGLIDGEPFVVEELLDLLLDLPFDESVFRHRM
jgi:hypothetical protein